MLKDDMRESMKGVRKEVGWKKRKTKGMSVESAQRLLDKRERKWDLPTMKSV